MGPEQRLGSSHSSHQILRVSKKVLLVEIRGSAKVYDGYLKGLSSIHRTGLAEMNQNATHVNVRATIGVNDLVGSYKASAKFINLVINLVKNVVVTALEIPLKKLVQDVLDN